jgi:F-type H+-transporting ATPase subunit b
MKKWMFALLLGACATLALMQAPARGAEPAIEPGSEATHEVEVPASPLYAPRQGVITGTVTIVVFAVLVAVLGKYAWSPIVKGLREREEKIRREIADAEAARARADKTLKEYDAKLASAEQQVRDLLAKATADAQLVATNVRMQAQKDAEEAKERANRDIEQARKSAVADVHRHAADLSTAIAEKILRRNLNADDQRELVNSSLDQLQSAGRL